MSRKKQSRMSWYEEAKRDYGNEMEKVLVRLGCKQMRFRWSPCPICGSETESKRTRYPIKVIRGDGLDNFICNACQAFGNVFELVAQAVYNETCDSLSAKGEWKMIKPFFTDEQFIKDPLVIEKPVVRYPPKDEVRMFCESKDIRHNQRVYDYLKGRNIDPGPGCPAMVADLDFDVEQLRKVDIHSTADYSFSGEADDGIIQRPWWSKRWLQSFPLLIPLCDSKGNLKSVLGRCVYKNRHRKSTVPTGYSTQNLFMISPKAMQWIHGKIIPEMIWVAEGEIDYLTLAQHGTPTIGIRNGRVDSLQLLPWKPIQSVIIATHNDEPGERYARAVASCVQPALPRRVNFNLLGG